MFRFYIDSVFSHNENLPSIIQISRILHILILSVNTAVLMTKMPVKNDAAQPGNIDFQKASIYT